MRSIYFLIAVLAVVVFLLAPAHDAKALQDDTEAKPPTPAPAPPPPPGVLLYNNLQCFNFNNTGPRYCADWNMRGVEGGNVSWEVLAYTIHRSREVFKAWKALTPSDVQAWLKALDTGLKWSGIARKKQVDITKPIATLPGGVAAIFISGKEGGFCAVRFHNPDWTKKAPIYMDVPYMEETGDPGSISDLIAALKAAPKKVKLYSEQKRKKDSLFK